MDERYMGRHPIVRLNDDLYRALGRYIVEFSRLIFWMRLAIMERLGGGDQQALALLFADTTAAPIVTPFFALAAHLGDLDEDELKVVSYFRTQTIEGLIRRRNSLLHGDWLLAGMNETEDAAIALLRRVNPASLRSPSSEERHTAKEIDGFTTELANVGNEALEVGAIALGVLGARERQTRIRDLYRMNKKIAVRDGPSANVAVRALWLQPA